MAIKFISGVSAATLSMVKPAPIDNTSDPNAVIAKELFDLVFSNAVSLVNDPDPFIVNVSYIVSQVAGDDGKALDVKGGQGAKVYGFLLDMFRGKPVKDASGKETEERTGYFVINGKKGFVFNKAKYLADQEKVKAASSGNLPSAPASVPSVPSAPVSSTALATTSPAGIVQQGKKGNKGK